MNERIKELAIEAGLESFYVEYSPWQVELKKFAELIAKECAWLAMNQHISTSPDEYDDMKPYQQGRDDTARTISGLIRRVFGVEE